MQRTFEPKLDMDFPSLSHLRGEPLLAAADHAGKVELAAVRGHVLLEPRLGAGRLAVHLAARPQAPVHLVVLLGPAQGALQLGSLLHHLPYHVRGLQRTDQNEILVSGHVGYEIKGSHLEIFSYCPGRRNPLELTFPSLDFNPFALGSRITFLPSSVKRPGFSQLCRKTRKGEKRRGEERNWRLMNHSGNGEGGMARRPAEGLGNRGREDYNMCVGLVGNFGGFSKGFTQPHSAFTKSRNIRRGRG